MVSSLGNEWGPGSEKNDVNVYVANSNFSNVRSSGLYVVAPGAIHVEGTTMHGDNKATFGIYASQREKMNF